jgi:hypothetical protein
MTRRYELDESPHAGDLELIGMLPSELRDLCLAFKALDFSLGSRRVTRGASVRGGESSDAVLNDAADKRRQALRRFRESMRKEIGRLADKIEKRVRQVKHCPVCNAENSWDDAWCGESFIPPERGCGYLFVKSDSRTSPETS